MSGGPVRTRDVTGRGRRALAALIELAFLAFGLIRIGVSMLVIAQGRGLVEDDELREATVDIAEFLSEHEARALVPFTSEGYLGYIAAMGVALVVGAVQSWRGSRWGTRLLGLYLVMHGALFVNFRVVNRKVAFLAIGVALLFALTRLKRRHTSGD